MNSKQIDRIVSTYGLPTNIKPRRVRVAEGSLTKEEIKAMTKEFGAPTLAKGTDLRRWIFEAHWVRVADEDT